MKVIPSPNLEPFVNEQTTKVKMNINDIPIFVSSSDSYADIWPAFFTILKREWPEYRGDIYLNTETLDYSFDGLNIVCTKLGPQKSFGKTFLNGIDMIKGDNFLLFMIDYFIEKRVDTKTLQEIYDKFNSDQIDAFVLMSWPYGFKAIPSHPKYSYLVPEDCWRIMFSFQIAFWKKSSLSRLIATWEDPWLAEWFGSKRAAMYDMKFYVLSSCDDMPIKYDAAGVLHGGGKWLDSAIKKINLKGVPLDLRKSRRDYFSEPTNQVFAFVAREVRIAPKKLLSWVQVAATCPSAIKFVWLEFVLKAKKLLHFIIHRKVVVP